VYKNWALLFIISYNKIAIVSTQFYYSLDSYHSSEFITFYQVI